jgi:hypothetical protein
MPTRRSYTPVEHARLMHAMVPDSTLVVVDDAGHLPNLERAAEFEQALLAFLRTTASADAAAGTPPVGDPPGGRPRRSRAVSS